MNLYAGECGSADNFDPIEISPPRVLIVEDDPSFARLVERAAIGRGAKVVVCGSPAEVARISAHDIDVAIIDLMLGESDGVDVARYLEALSQDLPVILMSSTRRRRTRAWPTTVREFIPKVFGPRAILEAAFESHELASVYRQIAARLRSHGM